MADSPNLIASVCLAAIPVARYLHYPRIPSYQFHHSVTDSIKPLAHNPSVKCTKLKRPARSEANEEMP